jgi:hypothetical protein
MHLAKKKFLNEGCLKIVQECQDCNFQLNRSLIFNCVTPSSNFLPLFFMILVFKFCDFLFQTWCLFISCSLFTFFQMVGCLPGICCYASNAFSCENCIACMLASFSYFFCLFLLVSLLLYTILFVCFIQYVAGCVAWCMFVHEDVCMHVCSYVCMNDVCIYV